MIGSLNISCQKSKPCAEENVNLRALLILDNASTRVLLPSPVTDRSAEPQLLRSLLTPNYIICYERKFPA